MKRDIHVELKRNNDVIPFPSQMHYNVPDRNFWGDGMDIQKYIDRLDQDRREMEKRLIDDRRLSEERIEKRVIEQEQRLEVRFNNIDRRFDRMEQKIDKLSEDVHRESKDTKRWAFGIFIAVAAMVVASVVGIAAIVIAVF